VSDVPVSLCISDASCTAAERLTRHGLKTLETLQQEAALHMSLSQQSSLIGQKDIKHLLQSVLGRSHSTHLKHSQNVRNYMVSVLT